MIEFHNFETFDPSGPGPRQPLRPGLALGGARDLALGRFPALAGGGAVPALGYYLGAAFAAILLVYGLLLCWRRRETAIVSGLARRRRRLRARPYRRHPVHRGEGDRGGRADRRPRHPPAAAAAAGRASSSRSPPAGCSLLALANAPVGPTDYSPALTGLRPLVADGSTLVSPPTACSTRNRASATSSGSCAAAGSASGPTREGSPRLAGKPPKGDRSGSALRGAGVATERKSCRRRALRRPAPAPRRRPYLLWETTARPAARATAP